MTKSEKLLLAELLELAADEFSNHTCNDMELPNTPENLKLVQGVQKSGADSDIEVETSEDDKRIYTRDYELMYYFAKLLKDETQAGNKGGGSSLEGKAVRLVSIEESEYEDLINYWLLEIPDDWDLEELKKEFWQGSRFQGSGFTMFLKERGAKELHFERFNAD